MTKSFDSSSTAATAGFTFPWSRREKFGSGDEFHFLASEVPSLTIAEFNYLYTSHTPDLDLLERAVEVKSLPESWRERFRARMEVVRGKQRI